MSEKLFIASDRCKSCGLCVVACPKDALSIRSESNSSGYKYIQVDEEKCVACAICAIACPDYVFTVKEVSA